MRGVSNRKYSGLQNELCWKANCDRCNGSSTFEDQDRRRSVGLAAGAPIEAQERPSVAPKNMQAIAPALADYADNVLFGDVWG